MSIKRKGSRQRRRGLMSKGMIIGVVATVVLCIGMTAWFAGSGFFTLTYTDDYVPPEPSEPEPEEETILDDWYFWYFYCLINFWIIYGINKKSN